METNFIMENLNTTKYTAGNMAMESSFPKMDSKSQKENGIMGGCENVATATTAAQM
jgi:hypothetical protein